MSKTEIYHELEALRATILDLEAQAGIAPEMERTREGHLFPNMSSTDNYFADEYDFLREKTRDAYFAVQDLSLKKKLICKNREIDLVIRKSIEDAHSQALIDVELSKINFNKTPWLRVSIPVLIAIAFGQWQWGYLGAFCGIFFGIIVGLSLFLEYKSGLNSAVQTNAQSLSDAKRERDDYSKMPETFSITEERTGIRDNRLDSISALENVIVSKDC